MAATFGTVLVILAAVAMLAIALSLLGDYFAPATSARFQRHAGNVAGAIVAIILVAIIVGGLVGALLL